MDDLMDHRIQKVVDFTHEKLKSDLLIEFARRIGMALKEGITPEMAIVAAQKHFRAVGRAMVDLVDDPEMMVYMRGVAKKAKDKL